MRERKGKGRDGVREGREIMDGRGREGREWEGKQYGEGEEKEGERNGEWR